MGFCFAQCRLLSPVKFESDSKSSRIEEDAFCDTALGKYTTEERKSCLIMEFSRDIEKSLKEFAELCDFSARKGSAISQYRFGLCLE
jgi:hypothetical protein